MQIYKSMKMDIKYVQTRRIQCKHCKNNFVLCNDHEFQAETRHGLLTNDVEKMHNDVLIEAFEKLSDFGRTEKQGWAKCPYCGKFQSWMNMQAYVVGMGCFSIIFIILTGFAGAGLSYLMRFSEEMMLIIAVAGGIIGLFFGLVVGFMRSRSILKPKNNNEIDLRAMSDEDFKKYVDDCEKENKDPSIKWYIEILKNKMPDKKTLFISLGFIDFVGGMKIPQHYYTDSVLKEISKKMK